MEAFAKTDSPSAFHSLVFQTDVTHCYVLTPGLGALSLIFLDVTDFKGLCAEWRFGRNRDENLYHSAGEDVQHQPRDGKRLDSQRGGDGGVNVAAEIHFLWMAVNRGQLPVYVRF